MMLTIKACCEKTGLPYSVIRKLCLQNKVKYMRSGTKYYILFSSLVEYLENGEAEQTVMG